METADYNGSAQPAPNKAYSAPPAARSKEESGHGRENTNYKSNECPTGNPTPEKNNTITLPIPQASYLVLTRPCVCRHFDMPSQQSV